MEKNIWLVKISQLFDSRRDEDTAFALFSEPSEEDMAQFATDFMDEFDTNFGPTSTVFTRESGRTNSTLSVLDKYMETLVVVESTVISLQDAPLGKEEPLVTWRDVLDGNKIGDMDSVNYVTEVVIPSGYRFFTYNGVVYEIDSRKIVRGTNLRVEDIG